MFAISVPLILQSMQFKAQLKTELEGDKKNVADDVLAEGFKDIRDFFKNIYM